MIYFLFFTLKKEIIHSSTIVLKNLIGDRDYKRLFVLNKSRFVYIYDIKNCKANILFMHVLTTQMKGKNIV